MRFSKASGLFWERYDIETDKTACDKYEARFMGDSRWTLFSYEPTLNFTSHVGYYGNSNCSSFGSDATFDKELIKKYLPMALNKLSRDIFNQMTDMAAKDAKAISNEAESEIAALQEMLNEAQTA